MPMFEYKCSGYQATRDLILPSAAKRPKQIKCQSCAFGRMKLVEFSRTGAPQFKGSGFYQTDYGAKGVGG